MPCRYVIDVEQQLVISTAWDRVTFADCQSTRARQFPEIQPQ